MIRNLGVNDANEIFLLSRNFADAWTEDMLISGFERGNLKGKGCFMDDGLVGYILYTPSVDFCDLEMVFVGEEFRGRKIAQTLMTAMEDEVRTCLKIMLEVREGNSSAISLYDKMGYQMVSVRRKYYSDGENALIMAKEF